MNTPGGPPRLVKLDELEYLYNPFWMSGILIYGSITFAKFSFGKWFGSRDMTILDLILHRSFCLLGYPCNRDPFYRGTQGARAPAHFEFPPGALLLRIPAEGLAAPQISVHLGASALQNRSWVERPPVRLSDRRTVATQPLDSAGARGVAGNSAGRHRGNASRVHARGPGGMAVQVAYDGDPYSSLVGHDLFASRGVAPWISLQQYRSLD